MTIKKKNHNMWISPGQHIHLCGLNVGVHGIAQLYGFLPVQHSLVRIYEELRKYEKLRNNGISAGKHITLCGDILY